jgi:hypothetical protein
MLPIFAAKRPTADRLRGQAAEADLDSPLADRYAFDGVADIVVDAGVVRARFAHDGGPIDRRARSAGDMVLPNGKMDDPTCKP